MKKKIIQIIGLLASGLIISNIAFAEGKIYIVPFSAINVDESIAEDFVEALSEQKIEGTIFVGDEDEKALQPFNDADLKQMVSKAAARTASHALGGTIERTYGEGFLIKSLLVSVQDPARVYKTEYFIQNDSQIKEAAKTIAGRLMLEIKGAVTGKVNAIQAKADEEKGVIVVNWEKRKDITEYAVYRSPVENGPFIKIAEVGNEESYIDNGAIRGIEYSYGVAPIIKSIAMEPSNCATAHLRMPAPSGLKIEEEKKKKTVTDKHIARELKNEVVRKHLEFLSDYYMHPVKLNLALYMGRSYIEKGQVIALSDFESHEIDREKKRIVLTGKDKSYIVEMEAASFFSFLAKAEERKIPEIPALIERLLKNAICYALPRGEKKIKDEYGHTIFLPYYEAIGMSTEYFKNYAKWENNTLMMSTSDRELKKKMKEVQQKGGKIE